MSEQRPPKILFHGTTLMRWANIKNDKRMRVDIPKYFESDKSKSAGFLFFTDNLEDAAVYGIATTLIDMKNLDSSILRAMAIKGRDIIILACRTSALRDRIELDPDGVNHRRDLKILGEMGYPRALEFAKSIWWRVKGDISIQNLFAYKTTPFDMVDAETLSIIQAGIYMTNMKEAFIAHGLEQNQK